MSEFRGLIVAVSGPSGVGKGTVLAKVEELLEQANPGSVGHSISVTTRAPRGQEKDGIEYFFRTKEQFEQMIKDGEIVAKKELVLPKEIRNVIKCHNPRCITSIEQGLPHIFVLADEKNEIYRCKYCEEKYSEIKQ